MSKFIKGFGFLILLGGISFFIWNNKKEPVALTPEELMKTMVAQKIETRAVGLKKFNPIFKRVNNLTELDAYKIKAINNKKLLLVYFYTNGCYFCEKMKNITFADTRVQEELLTNYIAISVNYSKSKNEFKQKFHLRATPAIVFFDKDGKRVNDEISYGYQGAEEFYNELELLAEPF